MLFYHAEWGARMGQVLRIDPLTPDRSVLERVAAVVRGGGVIVYPTDTIYGLGCAPDDQAAVERIFKIKRRAEGKGVLLLVPGVETVRSLCSPVPQVFEQLAEQLWPGPVTFLLTARSGLPRLISGDRDLLGLRNPDSEYLHLLMALIPGPLVSTSANVSGDVPTGRVADLKRQLADEVDLFVDGGDVRDAVASTVVDLSVTPPRIVRAGAVVQRVEQAIG